MTVSVDGTVLERIAKIMTYLRLGSSGKVYHLMVGMNVKLGYFVFFFTL